MAFVSSSSMSSASTSCWALRRLPAVGVALEVDLLALVTPLVLLAFLRVAVYPNEYYVLQFDCISDEYEPAHNVLSDRINAAQWKHKFAIEGKGECFIEDIANTTYLIKKGIDGLLRKELT
ncbi:hypothetical protein HD806DRAFT_533466 [Xylariaceae sp. AK1471]|nr:hypothetical protein HD806DRAFT_533466 [Xylariaceae sp. AK1471]